MKITIHEEKIAISHFTGKKKGRSRVTKIPFTTLLIMIDAPAMNNLKTASANTLFVYHYLKIPESFVRMKT